MLNLILYFQMLDIICCIVANLILNSGSAFYEASEKNKIGDCGLITDALSLQHSTIISAKLE